VYNQLTPLSLKGLKLDLRNWQKPYAGLLQHNVGDIARQDNVSTASNMHRTERMPDVRRRRWCVSTSRYQHSMSQNGTCCSLGSIFCSYSSLAVILAFTSGVYLNAWRLTITFRFCFKSSIGWYRGALTSLKRWSFSELYYWEYVVDLRSASVQFVVVSLLLQQSVTLLRADKGKKNTAHIVESGQLNAVFLFTLIHFSCLFNSVVGGGMFARCMCRLCNCHAV